MKCEKLASQCELFVILFIQEICLISSRLEDVRVLFFQLVRLAG